MLRKLRHLLVAWRMIRSFRIDEPEEWTAADAQAMRQFLLSKTGRKFGENLRSTAMQAAIGLTAGGKDMLYQSGYAGGMFATAAQIDSMAELTAGNIPDKRPADNLEWMNQ